MAGLLAV